MDLETLLTTKRIDFAERGDPHYRENWTHVCCPDCGDTSFKLGFAKGNISGRCFSCGRKTLVEFLCKKINCSRHEAYNLASQIKTDRTNRVKTTVEKKEAVEISLPRGSVVTPSEKHLNYLAEKNFTIKTIKDWNLYFTHSVGDHPWSIVIPIYQNGLLQSWQARDITSRASSKYSFPKHPSSHLLYGIDKAKESDFTIVVEGPTDAWRLRAGNSVATFGMGWSQEQLMLLKKNFSSVFVLYDEEPEAIEQGQKLCESLELLGCKAYSLEGVLDAYTDPCDLSQFEADELVRQCREFLSLQTKNEIV